MAGAIWYSSAPFHHYTYGEGARPLQTSSVFTAGAAYAHHPTPLGKDELLREMDAAGVDHVV
jgi:hypothetical protein